MKISILTVFPELHTTFLNTSLFARAQEQNLIQVQTIRFSDFCDPKERIDEPICGPGPGMVLKPQVIEKAVDHVQKQWGKGLVIFFSPQGKKISAPYIKDLLTRISEPPANSQVLENRLQESESHLIIVCPRYEGVDARVEAYYADEIISIGDFVVMGGDIPAQLFLEALVRFIPGVVGNQQSLKEDSFEGPLFDYPTYGLPLEWKGERVPEIVLSGNHAAINEWRYQKALEKTVLNRFDWFASQPLSKNDRLKAHECIPNHYAALLHNDIMVKGNQEGVTSITSIDVHDLARSCATYGLINLFIVSPLVDQQVILKTLLDFWRSDRGCAYNANRAQALSRVEGLTSIDEVVHTITAKEGAAPLIVATSAKHHMPSKTIDYSSQGELWKQKRPILFVFGTGQGLSNALLERCDYILPPIEGLPFYNHLSVRAATAIVLDRWLGLK